MTYKNEVIGEAVHKHLMEKGIETPIEMNEVYGGDLSELVRAFRTILEFLHLDLSDDSLADTPHRLVKLYSEEIFYGLDYANFPDMTTVENKMDYRQLIVVDNIEVHSVCEHHFLPFVGRCAVGYLPDKRVLGLSKFNRIVDFFARRPQIQERLTEQIAATLRFVLETDDVAVVLRADHSCVRLRGVQDTHSSTLTSAMAGKFLGDVPYAPNALREEFIRLAQINGTGSR